MRGKGLLVLVLLAGGLAFALWQTRERAAREEVPTESLLGGRRLFDATRIITRYAPDVRELHFARQSPADPYMMVEPVVDVAARAWLENLRGVLDSAQRLFDRPVAALTPDQLEQRGLDQPRAKIEVRYPDKTLAIAIGLEGPLHQDVYIAMDGNVYRAGRAVYSAICLNVDDARDHTLVQSHPEDIRRVTMTRRGADKGKDDVLAVVREGAADFAIERPLRTRANPHKAAALFSIIASMQVDQFLDGLNPMPEWQVQIEVEGGAGSEKLTFWTMPGGGVIGRQEPRAIEFSIKSVDYSRTFEVPMNELRATLLVPFAESAIERVEIDPGEGRGDRTQLRRGGDGALAMFSPFELATDPAAVVELLAATQKLEATEFVAAEASDLGRFGLDRGFLTVSLHPQLRQTPVVLHLGRDDGEQAFVRSEAEGFVVKVPKAVAAVLRRPWMVYATKALPELPPNVNVNEVRYRVADAEIAVFRRDGGQKWQRAGAQRDATEQVVELLDLAQSLRGKRVLDGDDPATGREIAAAKVVAIEFRRESGETVHELVLHDRGAHQQAWMPRRDQPRVVVELGVNDSRALLAPVRE